MVDYKAMNTDNGTNDDFSIKATDIFSKSNSNMNISVSYPERYPTSNEKRK